ncbi:hypothetical protein AArcSl_2963 [Halalkaliarchaeum desulfuricum]|uniref:DUF433 domain-containing protein n=2 Tax=Halalkaliarchaeum desulfuricum TaxID=2055893 RepID=A0A343TNA2_9EURY|nr:hypothetical protein AArcSl_2963 [Halalkaliarchaeum desulfuricum]
MCGDGQSTHTMTRIVRTDDVLGGEPRIEGTRIGVRHVAARTVDAGQPPVHVADQLGVSLSEVYEGLSYYYAHVEELREFERANEAAFDRIENESLEPNERVQ